MAKYSSTRKPACDPSRNRRTCQRGTSQELAGYSVLFLYWCSIIPLLFLYWRPLPLMHAGGCAFGPAHWPTALDSLHNGDQAEGEQWQAAYVRARQDQPAPIDGLASPDGICRTGHIFDPFIAGNVPIRLRVGPAMRRQHGAHDDFLSGVIAGPGESQLLIKEEDPYSDRQRQQAQAGPPQRMPRLVPAPRGEEHQPKHNRDDELAQPQPDLFLAGQHADRGWQQKASQYSGDPQCPLRQHQPTLAGLLQPGLIARARGHQASSAIRRAPRDPPRS